jgi:hypothetical protein
MWGNLSDEKTGLSFTIGAGSRQSSHSAVQVLQILWQHLTISFESTGFPFCRLLWLVGLRWRYSNPPPPTCLQSWGWSWFTTDGQSASILVSGSHLKPMTRFFCVWQLRVSWYGTPSLTRGWVCNLLTQLLSGLARAVTLVSKSRRTHDQDFTLSLRHPQVGGPGLLNYIPKNRVAQLLSPGLVLVI